MTPRARQRALRWLLWLLLGLPLGYIVAGYATGRLYYGEVVHLTGDLSVKLLIVAMAATPLLLWFPARAVPRWLARNRRYIGVASFAYAAVHTGVYLERTGVAADVLADAARAEYLTGWIAMAIFTALALTSNDVSVRRLRRGWKALHRLVYAAAALALVHWVLTAFDPLAAWLHAGVLAGLEALRIRQRRRVLAGLQDRQPPRRHGDAP